MISKLFERVLLLEKKDHLIKKLKSLTDDQKQQLIDHFKKFPHLESKIDWNNRNLTWKEFEPLLSEVSKSQFKKNMSKKEMGGLQEGKDYRLLYDQDNIFLAEVLNYRQSVYFGSKNFMGHEGKWCISSNDDHYWKQYTEKGSRFIIAQIDSRKFMINDREQEGHREYFDVKDISHSTSTEWNQDYIQKIDPILYKVYSQRQPIKRIKYIKNICNIGTDVALNELKFVAPKLGGGRDFQPPETIIHKDLSQVTDITISPEVNSKNLKDIDSLFKSINFPNTVIYIPDFQDRLNPFYFNGATVKSIDFSKSNIIGINISQIYSVTAEEIIFPAHEFYIYGDSRELYQTLKTKKLTNIEYQIFEDPEIQDHLNIDKNVTSFNNITVPDIVYVDQYPISLLATKPYVEQILYRGKIFPCNSTNLTFKYQKKLKKIQLGPVANKQQANDFLTYEAFQKLPNLQEVDLSQSGIEYIKQNVFAGCPNLEKIILPTSLKILGANWISSSPKVTELINYENTQVTSVAENEFQYSSLKKLILPKTVHRVKSNIAPNSLIEILDMSRTVECLIAGDFQDGMKYIKTVILPADIRSVIEDRLKTEYPNINFIKQNPIQESKLFNQILNY